MKPDGFAIANLGRGSLQQESLKMKKPNNLGNMTKERTRGNILVGAAYRGGMMSLIMPLPRSGTTTRVTAVDVVGLETDKVFWATTTTSASAMQRPSTVPALSPR